MVELKIDSAALQQFEDQFDTVHPEMGQIPARVLGYGEISTVLAIDSLASDVAFKRMSMFETAAEAAAYMALYEETMTALSTQVGLQLVPGELVTVRGVNGRPIIYLVQPRLNPQTIASKTIHLLVEADQVRLFTAVLQEIGKVFSFNQLQESGLIFGMDGQLSNWAVRGFDGQNLPAGIVLEYLDTSSPLLQKDGVEQLDTELFLRSAPAFLRWLLRWLYLEDVVSRYYDLHQVFIDLIANLYKEQLPQFVPLAVVLANEFLAEWDTAVEPITLKMVQSYYKEDAFIWRIYLGFRRLDRWLHRLFGKPYPYVLPGQIKR